MPLNNLLNDLNFGATIQQDGKPYTVIMRLTDRLFIAMEQGAQLPCPLMLVQVDILMGPGADPGAGGQGQGQPPGPGQNGPAGSGPGGPGGPPAPPDDDKKETVH